MFSGIVQGLGQVISIDDRPNFRVLEIETKGMITSPSVGGSVAVNGVCLTVTKIENTCLTFEVMQETLKRSTFEYLQAGDRVGLEAPLKIGDELGGHIVQGHVDGTAQILEKDQSGDNVRMRFLISADLGKYLVDKGSVAVDGISLTVCVPTAYPKESTTTGTPSAYTFDVWLLPLTLERTTLGFKQVGERVNIEVDFLIKALFNRIEALNLKT